MKIVEKKRKEVKKKMGKLVQEAESIETRVELIQALIPVGLMYVNELLQEDVRKIVGERYSRARKTEGVARWGKQPGSVYLKDQKVPVEVPRVRNLQEGKEMQLETYRQLQRPYRSDEGLLNRVLSGLSCRRYEECAETIPGVFGLSASTVSRRNIRASARKLRQLMERRLDNYDIVAILMDGKTFAEDEMIIALGITITGEKVILGIVQSATENAKVCSEFLEKLKERGLRYENGILFVVDGSKGIIKAINKTFGGYGVIQRCQWHKRENVISYLPKSKKEEVKQKLQSAYEKPTYSEAKASLLRLKKELRVINESAAASLEEGFEETLTLHKLGLFEKIGISFKTTNCIESIMAQIGQLTDKVDYWKNSNQKMRWLASALLDIELRLRKVKGWKYLPVLRTALIRHIKDTVEERVAA